MKCTEPNINKFLTLNCETKVKHDKVIVKTIKLASYNVMNLVMSILSTVFNKCRISTQAGSKTESNAKRDKHTTEPILLILELNQTA